MNAKKKLTMQTFQELLNKHQLLEKYELNQIGIFGSLARGETARDVDILIEQFQDYRQLLAFKADLEKRLHKPVDIVIKKFANPIILHRAQKDLIYVTRPAK